MKINKFILNEMQNLEKLKTKLLKLLMGRFFTALYGPKEVASESKIKNLDVQIKSLKLGDFEYKTYGLLKGKLFAGSPDHIAISSQEYLIPGASWQWRDGNILAPCESPVFIKGTPYPLKQLNGKVLSLLTGGSGNYNYYHWLYDVLPRIYLFQCLHEIADIDHFLIPSLNFSFQRESLAILELPQEKLVSNSKFKHIEADELIVVDHPNPNRSKPPEWITNWLKETFIPNISSKAQSFIRWFGFFTIAESLDWQGLQTLKLFDV